MAEAKNLVQRTIEKFLPGDQEPGETAPSDDSHVKGSPAQHLLPDDGGAVAEIKAATDEEPTYRVEIAGTMREVDEATYNLVMEERAQHGGAGDLDPDPDPDPEPEFDAAEFYGDPESYIKKAVDEGVQKATTISRQSYAADKAQNDFWNAFYSENPLLKDEQMLTKMMLAQNMKSLKGLDAKSGRDKLARLVETEILRISNKQGGRRKEPDESSTLEGGSAPAPAMTTEESDRLANETPQGRPPSIGDEIKARKLRRDRAKRGESTQLS
tara:strand:- start:596 stop:1405 length:810 start_codon:yes stop_codon:yes gene_type:complete